MTVIFLTKLIPSSAYPIRRELLFSPYGTPLTLATSEVSEQHKMVMLACAASGEQIWERQCKYIFGVYALAKRYFIDLLDLMAREGFEKVAILYENSPFHKDVAAGTAYWVKRFGIEVTLKKAFINAKSEFPKLLGKPIDVNADGLILSAYSQECYQFLDLMKEINYRPKVLGITIAPIHPDFFKKAGNIAEGIFGPSQWEPDKRIPFAGTKKFIEGFVGYIILIICCTLGIIPAVLKNGLLTMNPIRYDFLAPTGPPGGGQ